MLDPTGWELAETADVDMLVGALTESLRSIMVTAHSATTAREFRRRSFASVLS